MDGMLLCRAQGINNVCVESEAALVIRKVRGMSQYDWRYVYLIPRVKDLLQSFGEVDFYL